MIEEILLGGALASIALKQLKGLVKEWVCYWTNAWIYFRRRPYDLDGNPYTLDYCLLENPASGEKDIVGLTHSLTLDKDNNGVYIHYFNDNWVEIAQERVPFDKWSELRKAKLKIKLDFDRPKSQQFADLEVI